MILHHVPLFSEEAFLHVDVLRLSLLEQWVLEKGNSARGHKLILKAMALSSVL